MTNSPHAEPRPDEESERHLAVPGSESHENEDALSPDERGTEDAPVPEPSEPKQP
jgi:hypothetical protein